MQYNMFPTISSFFPLDIIIYEIPNDSHAWNIFDPLEIGLSDL